MTKEELKDLVISSKAEVLNYSDDFGESVIICRRSRKDGIEILKTSGVIANLPIEEQIQKIREHKVILGKQDDQTVKVELRELLNNIKDINRHLKDYKKNIPIFNNHEDPSKREAKRYIRLKDL